MSLRFVAALVAATLLACSPAASGVTSERDRATGWRYSAPAALPTGAKRWYGACTAKAVHGPGVLHMANAAFYGTMANGSPLRGAIEDSSGIMFGRFVGGKLVQSDQPQDNLNSYRAAASGARAASARFAKAKNQASASFYAAKARMFDDYDH